ncbi:MAG: hypothetical protein SFU87_19815 [Chitinophagaceae bacterium]|nr:hypothetical protein [Chitinophagaceae bacterium]
MQRLLIIKLILLILVSACQHNKGADIYIPEGGYNFPKSFADKDTLLYIYPIKDIIPTRDSFQFSTYSEFLYKSFNEPNLSLRPTKELVYRLIYQPGFTGYVAILTLQDRKMIIKELESGNAMPYIESERLDSSEQEHLRLFRTYFPLNKYSGKAWTKKYLDSMTKLYPELLAANYYRTLTIKAATWGSEPFSYNKREISLEKGKYDYFMNLISQSGYWKMKPIEHNCIGEASHPDGYVLEGATQKKYNFVDYTECLNDSSRFAKAVKELIEYSKLEENHRKWNDQLFKKKK